MGEDRGRVPSPDDRRSTWLRGGDVDGNGTRRCTLSGKRQRKLGGVVGQGWGDGAPRRAGGWGLGGSWGLGGAGDWEGATEGEVGMGWVWLGSTWETLTFGKPTNQCFELRGVSGRRPAGLVRLESRARGRAAVCGTGRSLERPRGTRDATSRRGQRRPRDGARKETDGVGLGEETHAWWGGSDSGETGGSDEIDARVDEGEAREGSTDRGERRRIGHEGRDQLRSTGRPTRESRESTAGLGGSDEDQGSQSAVQRSASDGGGIV